MPYKKKFYKKSRIKKYYKNSVIKKLLIQLNLDPNLALYSNIL